MFKKFISVFCMFFGILTAAHAGPAANIEYVHKMIAHVWGIEIPYNPELKNPRFAANMEYLLAAVDVANEKLNGYKATDYKSDPKYATRYIADTLATNKAVHELIKIYYPFKVRIKTTDNNQTFYFGIAARGKFYVDWGDGSREIIDLTDIDLSNIDLSALEIEHTYSSAGEYTVSLGGRATEYADQPDTLQAAPADTSSNPMPISAISFQENPYVTEIEGSLSAVFPTLDSGENPSFYALFLFCQNLTGKIPEKLFAGIHGQPSLAMYAGLFFGTGISGTIPDGLFGELSGEWAEGVFMGTFAGCSGLTGEIPENLLGDLSGDLKFMSLGGEIGMFTDCSGLTGPSAKIGGKYLYEIWPDATEEQVGGMYWGATGLSDWCQIPYPWRDADPLCDIDAEFAVHVKTASANSTFKFILGAAGEFTVDWGDGTVETIVKDNTDREIYTHKYANAGGYIFGISGQATDYATDGDTGATFTFYTSYSNTNQIYNIRGSLGHVFGTLADGSQPRFLNLFRGATNMTIVVPENLFDGVYGQPISSMFEGAFDTSGIVGFAGPLFAGISGTPTNALYMWTFSNCNELSLPLPDGMFGNLTGDLGNYTFSNTFYNSNNMTGSSARDANGRYLYEIWPDATWDHVIGMYCNDSQYTDMDSIPSAWTGCPDA